MNKKQLLSTGIAGIMAFAMAGCGQAASTAGSSAEGTASASSKSATAAVTSDSTKKDGNYTMIRVPKVSVYDPANLYTVCSLTTEYSS